MIDKMIEKRILVVFKICSNTSEIIAEESGYYSISQFIKRINELKVHNIDVWCMETKSRDNYLEFSEEELESDR